MVIVCIFYDNFINCTKIMLFGVKRMMHQLRSGCSWYRYV